MSKKDQKTDALAKARELRGSPLGNLLLEDATASKVAGRMTARVAVGADGNPVVFSTDETTREAIVRSIQERTRVDYMDIPEVSEQDFRKLLNDGVKQLSQGERTVTYSRSTLRLRACGKVHDGPCAMEEESAAASPPASAPRRFSGEVKWHRIDEGHYYATAIKDRRRVETGITIRKRSPDRRNGILPWEVVSSDAGRIDQADTFDQAKSKAERWLKKH